MKEIKIKEGIFAKVDDEDYDFLNSFNWYLTSSGYAYRQVRIGKRQYNKRRNIFMSKVILNCPVGFVVDHKDRDRLNNQRYNLRIATEEQNNRNKGKVKGTISKYIGVTIGRNGKYVASITYKRKKYYFGTNHLTDLDAAVAYNKGVLKFNDGFINLNTQEEVLKRLKDLTINK